MRRKAVLPLVRLGYRFPRRTLHIAPGSTKIATQLRELESRVQADQRDRLELLIEHSRELRRDRELAFYGSEDLTPSEFYSRKDAERAFGYARDALAFVEAMIGS